MNNAGIVKITSSPAPAVGIESHVITFSSDPIYGSQTFYVGSKLIETNFLDKYFAVTASFGGNPDPSVFLQIVNQNDNKFRINIFSLFPNREYTVNWIACEYAPEVSNYSGY